jgi:hypothetical protein
VKEPRLKYGPDDDESPYRDESPYASG